jgi:predicted nucleotidyltransferase
MILWHARIVPSVRAILHAPMATPMIPPEAAALAARLLEAQRQVLGDRLLALYLFGSATTGSFQAGVSDVDTLAVLAGDLSEKDLAGLANMHERLIKDAPTWYDRVEVDYLSAKALANFRTGSWPAARISPGEPFHPIQIDHRWITDWYHVLISGVTLSGPPPQGFIPPISHQEFVEAVRQQLLEWPDRLTEHLGPGGLTYAVLTACRALRVCRTGDYVSKKEAAEWAGEQLPEFRDLIRVAVAQRYQPQTAGAPVRPSLADTRRFVEAILDLCANER